MTRSIILQVRVVGSADILFASVFLGALFSGSAEIKRFAILVVVPYHIIHFGAFFWDAYTNPAHPNSAASYIGAIVMGCLAALYWGVISPPRNADKIKKSE